MSGGTYYQVGDILVSDEPDDRGMYEASDGNCRGWSRTKFGALAYVLQQKADLQLKRHLEARRDAALRAEQS